MEIIGIIAEYNPFHSGHRYHINKIKEMCKDSVIIAVVSSSFTERGNVSVLNKWDKTKIALDNGVDLVIELPFVYSSQSADIFAKGAVKILNALKVDKIVFGSECNDIYRLKEIASIQVNNNNFDEKVKKYLKDGNNYPTSISKALKDENIKKIDSPNDLLAISYLKEIIRNNYNIEGICIQRTNNYHGNNNGKILSASELRTKIRNGEDIKDFINYDEDLIYKNTDFFALLKYQIINNFDILDKFQTVDEGIENRIKKYIFNVKNTEELIDKLKTKRYTYNKINRMLIHILTGLSKEEAKLNIDYIRVLGFNKKGRDYLNKRKKETTLKIITKYKDIDSPLLEFEKKASFIYSIIVNDSSLIKKEFEKPIYKE